MHKSYSGYWIAVISAVAITAAGYAVMRIATHAMPMENGSTGLYTIVTVVITLLGMIIPFLILKSFFIGASINDSRETTIGLEDLPKDQSHIAAKH